MTMTVPDCQVQEENKTLDRMYKTKVEEVTKLTSQIEALEEAVAEASKHVSTIKDLERQNQDMKVSMVLKIMQGVVEGIFFTACLDVSEATQEFAR